MISLIIVMIFISLVNFVKKKILIFLGYKMSIVELSLVNIGYIIVNNFIER